MRKKVLVVFIPILSFFALGILLLLWMFPSEVITGHIRSWVFSSTPIDLTTSQELLIEEGFSVPLENPRLIVSKSAREMKLFDGEELIRVYRIGLGSNPLGPKKAEGDGKTPEGEYFLCTRLNPSRYHLFLGISYPSMKDAELQDDLEEALLEQIRESEINRNTPPWNTPLGGAVGIHGGGSSDWTAGCIALDNREMREVFLLTKHGTPITITP